MVQKVGLTLTIVAAIALASGARAQAEPMPTPNRSLAGLDAVRLSISPATPDAGPCGVDLQALLTAAGTRLESGGLPVESDTSALMVLSVLTRGDLSGGQCASTIMLGIYKRVSYFDEDRGALREGDVVLWQRGVTTLTRQADHQQGLADDLDRVIDSLLVSWEKDKRDGSADRVTRPLGLQTD